MSSYHDRPAPDVLEELGVSVSEGLGETEIGSRRARFGPNRLRVQKPRSAWLVFVSQFRSLVVALLLAAVALSVVFADWLEAAAIGVVIALNAAIGFGSELRAVRSMEALRSLGRATAAVRRGGTLKKIPADDLVPGDIVLVEAGDVVVADLRIVTSSKLQADESTLTGESTPVDKHEDAVPADAGLADRASILFKGTAVTRGSAEGVVCATGMQTELGHVSALVEESADEGLTPLERRLFRLGRSLVWLTLGTVAVVAAVGVLSGDDPYLTVKTAIALAVAAVPEGLPIVATLALARGMWRMVRRNVLVNRLAAVETLGATTLILVDKTGTLTENRMTVRAVVTREGEATVSGGPFDETGVIERGDAPLDASRDAGLRALFEVAVLCNGASWSRDAAEQRPVAVGDPMEVALLVAGTKAGIPSEAAHEAHPEIDRIAFDPSVNMMATLHRADSAVRVAVKGAPEAVLAASVAVRDGDQDAPMDDGERERWKARVSALGDAGLRVIALAEKRVADRGENPWSGLTLLGLIGLVDPPREDVRPAIASCRAAGVRVVVATGDHAATARYVARAVAVGGTDDVVLGTELGEGRLRQLARDADDPGREAGDRPPLPREPDPAFESRVLAAPVFARVSPSQKLELVRLFRRHGEVVAMTGDGVNDAPALQAADIGIAMGVRGTNVAREASDMVLLDDAFSSIAAAISEGRVIFDNIRAFIRYLISCNLSEIIVVLLGVVAQTPLPILPLQILFLNLVTDVFPALALGLGEGDEHVMTRPPREPSEPVLTRRHWTEIAVFGGIIAVSVLGALLISLRVLEFDESRAVTVSFLTLALAQLWHVFNMRPPGSRFFVNRVTRNRYVWLALGLCVGLIFAAVHVPLLAAALRTTQPGRDGWLLAGAMSLLPTVLGQAWLGLRKVRSARAGTAAGA